MTQYFCSKCNKITNETKDFYEINNKPCAICGEITKPIPNQHDFNIETKEIIKYKGIWEIHKNDKDPFPSNPHAHNKETGEKLNLSTGEIHNIKTRQIVGKLNTKELNEIRKKSRILQELISSGTTSPHNNS